MSCHAQPQLLRFLTVDFYWLVNLVNKCVIKIIKHVLNMWLREGLPLDCESDVSVLSQWGLS